MNKLFGFFELKDSLLPTIPWKIYNKDTKFDADILWTVRTAVHHGEDLNLPRCVGAVAEKAKIFAKEASEKYGENGMVIYYPYFIAEKSGTLNVYSNKIVIEAVKDDLWNLVSDGKCDATYIITGENREYYGDKFFLTKDELDEIISYVREVKRMFRDDLLQEKSVLLEWSFAYKCNGEKKKVGDRYLVFYEARTV